MANILKLKSRAADATAPTTGNLADREVAISIPGKTIYINDAGTVKAVANYFPDAASDGKQYARKDGAWAEVASSGGAGNIPIDVKSANYTFVAGDAGRNIVKTASSAYTFTLNNSVFSAGDWFMVSNFGSSQNITIARGSGVTLYYAGSTMDSNKTVVPGGIATVYMYSAAIGYVFGTGVG